MLHKRDCYALLRLRPDATPEEIKKAFRRRAKQLCPVPGCTNPAAPVFGMVCAKHKDVPKAQIKKYRETRRAAKQKGRKAK